MGAEAVVQPTLTTTSDRPAELILAQANAIANQLFVINVNAPGPAAVGDSLIVDPEGIVRVRAGQGDELMTAVIDLDDVERVRRHGLAGVSRIWNQLQRMGPQVELPAYGGRYRTTG